MQSKLLGMGTLASRGPNTTIASARSMRQVWCVVETRDCSVGMESSRIFPRLHFASTWQGTGWTPSDPSGNFKRWCNHGVVLL